MGGHLPTIPDGWILWQIAVHPDDKARWRVAAAAAGAQMQPWARAVLNEAAGLPQRPTKRKTRRIETQGDRIPLRKPLTTEAPSSAVMAPLAPACTHVSLGAYCNRCGSVRP